MAASFMYSFFTAFGVILIGTGMALQVLYIEEEINKEDNSYIPMQIASILINSLVVAYLLISITFYRPYETNFALFGSTLVLLMGLVGEIYLTNFGESNVGKGFAYTFAVINALVRLYLLIAVRCNSYLTTIPGLVNEISKQAKSTGQSVDKVVSTVSKELANQGEQLTTVDPMNIYRNVMTGLGSVISDLPEDKKNAARDAVRKGVGAPPRNTQGGRRR